ncbi:MAG: hypothetical protein LCH76_00930 [Actinobacteria bacterium]|nr:hypothetical protein [Actinomycetota bacterium]
MQAQPPDPERNRKILRVVAVGLGLWFLGSGAWGLLTATPADRATEGCEAAARAKAADASMAAVHTLVREDSAGWFVAGEVRQTVDGVTSVAYQWECAADQEGHNPTVTGWTPAS